MLFLGIDVRLPCPALENKEQVRNILNSKCLKHLPGLTLVRATPRKCPGLHPCRWEVQYRLREHYYDTEAYKGGEFAKALLRGFEAYKPDGTDIMEPGIALNILEDGPVYVIEYGLTECGCDKYFW